jgi:hypothetical protein
MDTAWQAEFRRRLSRFGEPKTDDAVPVSIKIRTKSGCFHREHSPEAFRLIGNYLWQTPTPDVPYQIEEHESGPEILVYLAATTAGLVLAKSIVELVTAIIKARSDGIKKGDSPSAPLELIVRGYSKNGEYFEETILHVPPDRAVTAKLIESVLAEHRLKTEKRDLKEGESDGV